MAALTDVAENKLIDFIFRGQALGFGSSTAAAGTGPATLWVGLLTAQATDAAVGTEVTGGSYARVPVTSSLANWAGTQGAGTTTASTGSSGTTSNNNPVNFATPTANWGAIVGWALYDALTGGNQVIEAALTVGKTVNNADAAPSFAAGQLTYQIDN